MMEILCYESSLKQLLDGYMKNANMRNIQAKALSLESLRSIIRENREVISALIDSAMRGKAGEQELSSLLSQHLFFNDQTVLNTIIVHGTGNARYEVEGIGFIMKAFLLQQIYVLTQRAHSQKAMAQIFWAELVGPMAAIEARH